MISIINYLMYISAASDDKKKPKPLSRFERVMRQTPDTSRLRENPQTHLSPTHRLHSQSTLDLSRINSRGRDEQTNPLARRQYTSMLNLNDISESTPAQQPLRRVEPRTNRPFQTPISQNESSGVKETCPVKKWLEESDFKNADIPEKDPIDPNANKKYPVRRYPSDMFRRRR